MENNVYIYVYQYMYTVYYCREPTCPGKIQLCRIASLHELKKLVQATCQPNSGIVTVSK